MKRILIVSNNLDGGGIQKALINMLKELSTKYDVTLLLFSCTGLLISEVSPAVKIITARPCYKMLGLTRNELKKYPMLFGLKAVLKAVASLFGRSAAMRLLGLFQPKIDGYDVAISSSHLTFDHGFENGCADFVLQKTTAPQKMCLVHCDYKNSGTGSEKNNQTYLGFDKIICVSDSVGRRFKEIAPALKEKTVAIRNFYDLEIPEKAELDTVNYDKSKINVLMVARLSPEKGIGRALEALKRSGRSDIAFHIVGGGPCEGELKKLCRDLEIEEAVVFYGEDNNPFRYMRNADYLLVSSFHEAAPMIFDEAHALGLRIISTELLSAREMLGEDDVVCENSTEGITKALACLERYDDRRLPVLSNSERLGKYVEIIEGETK